MLEMKFLTDFWVSEVRISWDWNVGFKVSHPTRSVPENDLFFQRQRIKALILILCF